MKFSRVSGTLSLNVAVARGNVRSMAKRLYDALLPAHDEEEVKANFLAFFKKKVCTLGRIDHYTKMVLHEFKHDRNFKSRRNIATALAQTMYYAHHLKFSSRTEYSGSTLPPSICVIDKNEAFLVKTVDYKDFYTSKKYDWDRAASTPDPELIGALERSKQVGNIKVYNFAVEEEEKLFIEHYKRESEAQMTFALMDKKAITENNFWYVFSYWNTLFGEAVRNGHQASEYFLADVEQGKSFPNPLVQGEYYFKLNDGQLRQKYITPRTYNHFWDNYEKLLSRQMKALRQKADRLIEVDERRFRGDFYTPIEFAQKGLEYLEREIGKEWWKSGKYRFWDMCAGTGNLEFDLPTSALKYCYISTIREDETNYCRRIYPQAAGVFQYDYLNDDIDYLAGGHLKYSKPKMPEMLRKDLANPDLKWIVFINPPFVTAQAEGKDVGKESKDGVSKTQLRTMMTEEGYGAASRELFTQFLYRIDKEFKDRDCHLCLFSKIKYLTATNDQPIRDGFFNYKYKRGFLLPSKSFHGTKGKFPVGFLIWDMGKRRRKPLSQQNIVVDIFNADCEKIGTKQVLATDRMGLNEWCPRPSRSVKQGAGTRMPRFSSPLVLQTKNKDERGTVAKGFICCCSSNGDDFQHTNGVFLLSAPYASAGAFSVVPDNFEQAMVLFAVKRIPKATWINDKNLFYAPTQELPREFINDCVMYAAFAQDNGCVSLKDVEYDGKVYQIENNMYPFTLDEICNWACTLEPMRIQIGAANEDRYMADWLAGRRLSKEARAVLDSARGLYRFFYQEIINTDWKSARIDMWDVGLYQIKKALQGNYEGEEKIDDLKKKLRLLGDKILPQIFSYGFLDDDIELFENV